MQTSHHEHSPLPRAEMGAAAPGGLREVSVLAFPVILAQLSKTALGFTDSAMVGRLGAVELASVGFAGIWAWTFFCVFIGTSSGVQTFVAQADGAERRHECGGWVWQALYLLIPLSAVACVILFMGFAPFVSWLGPSDELQVNAAAYFRPRVLGLVAFTTGMVIESFFRGLGDTRTPLYATLLANVLNLVLDYGLIFGELGLPRWGVAGAGIATAIAECVYAAYLIAAFRRHRVRERYRTQRAAPNRHAMRRFVRTGAPIGGEWLIGMLSFAVFSTLLARMGDASMAASQAFIVLLSLSFMQSIGISVAAATLVGRYIGAGDPSAVRRVFWSSQKLAAMLGGAVAILFVSAPSLLLRIFTDDPNVIALGSSLVILGAAFQLFDALGIVADGSLRGAGDTRWPFYFHAAFAWLFFVPLAYAVGVVHGGGAWGAWLVGTVYVVVLALVLIWRFESGAWERIRI